MKSAALWPHAPRTEYWFEEGCYILEMSNTADDPAVSIARARVPAGGATHLHRLNGIAERYVVLEGTGIVEVEGLGRHEVETGDVVLIPPGCAQRISNTGTGELAFLAICTPRFVPGAYEALESPA